MFPQMAKVVPQREVGVAKVVHQEVTRLDSLRDLMHGIRTDPGIYAVLRIKGQTMMSDTHAERVSNWKAVHEARGNVLVAGLGIGMILHPMLEKKEVESITVVELHQDVIDIIADTFPKKLKKKLRIVQGDIFQWRPEDGQRFDFIYFDIWADATEGAATPDKRKLAARFRRFKAKGGLMMSWKPAKTFR